MGVIADPVIYRNFYGPHGWHYLPHNPLLRLCRPWQLAGFLLGLHKGERTRHDEKTAVINELTL